MKRDEGFVNFAMRGILHNNQIPVVIPNEYISVKESCGEVATINTFHKEENDDRMKYVILHCQLALIGNPLSNWTNIDK